MFKFRKQHFPNEIYYFVFFFKVISTILEDFDVLILLMHLSLKGCHHVTVNTATSLAETSSRRDNVQ